MVATSHGAAEPMSRNCATHRTELDNGSRPSVPDKLPHQSPQGAGRAPEASTNCREGSRRVPGFSITSAKYAKQSWAAPMSQHSLVVAAPEDNVATYTELSEVPGFHRKLPGQLLEARRALQNRLGKFPGSRSRNNLSATCPIAVSPATFPESGRVGGGTNAVIATALPPQSWSKPTVEPVPRLPDQAQCGPEPPKAGSDLHSRRWR